MYSNSDLSLFYKYSFLFNSFTTYIIVFAFYILTGPSLTSEQLNKY
jgi:hypothetical protein